MNIKLLVKLTEEELLTLKKGDVFYHVNPFGCGAGKIPTVQKYTLLCDWFPYISQNYYLNGKKRVKYLNEFESDLLGFCSNETEGFLSDMVRLYKGNFLNEQDAKDFAKFCCKDNETNNKVRSHHNTCDYLFRGL